MYWTINTVLSQWAKTDYVNVDTETELTLNLSITTMLNFLITSTESKRIHREYRNGQSYVTNTADTVTIAEDDYGKPKMWLCLAI